MSSVNRLEPALLQGEGGMQEDVARLAAAIPGGRGAARARVIGHGDRQLQLTAGAAPQQLLVTLLLLQPCLDVTQGLGLRDPVDLQ